MVTSSALARRHVAILAWCPETSTSGTLPGIYKAVGSGFILYAVTAGGSVLGENFDITFGDVLFISG